MKCEILIDNRNYEVKAQQGGKVEKKKLKGGFD